MGQDGRFATDLSIQEVSVETVVQEVVVKTVVQEVVVETVVRCIELRADESGPRAWVQPAARGREGRSVRQSRRREQHVRSRARWEESERTGWSRGTKLWYYAKVLLQISHTSTSYFSRQSQI